MPSEMTTESVEALAAGLVGHEYVLGGIFDACSCGWRGNHHHRHVAQALVASGVVRLAGDVRGEAWEEGANAAVELHNAGTRMTLRAVIPHPANPYRTKESGEAK